MQRNSSSFRSPHEGKRYAGAAVPDCIRATKKAQDSMKGRAAVLVMAACLSLPAAAPAAAVADPAGADRQHVRAGRRRRSARPHGRGRAEQRFRATVHRRDPRRRWRRHRGAVRDRDASGRLQLRHYECVDPGAGADQQSKARLRAAARSRQHRLYSGLAHRAVGQSGKRHQDARSVHRQCEEGRQALALFVIGRRQHGAIVRRILRPTGRHRDRARAL